MLLFAAAALVAGCGGGARTATPEEKDDLWRTMTAVWPAYDEYQAKTEREIPVVVLERQG